MLSPGDTFSRVCKILLKRGMSKKLHFESGITGGVKLYLQFHLLTFHPAITPRPNP